MAQPHIPSTTINDIARLAGVSKTTVSRYINGKADLISAPTCARIKRAIERTGYRPSATAQNLSVGNKLPTVGIVVQDLSEPKTATAVQHIICSLQARNICTMVSIASHNDGKRISRNMDLMIRRGVHELIVCEDLPLSDLPPCVNVTHLSTTDDVRQAATRLADNLTAPSASSAQPLMPTPRTPR